MSVKRYQLIEGGSESTAYMQESIDGDYVTHNDYVILQSSLRMLENRNSDLENKIDSAIKELQ